MHNPGSMGTWLEFDRVINSGPVCSCGPVLDAVPSMDRSRGTYLQFPRVISAEPVGSCDPLRAGWQFDRVINAGPVLDAVPSIDQRRPGQQLRFPREGTRCTTLDPMAGSMHNPGSNGRKYAQSRIPGPAVCTTLDSRPAVCRRLHTFGERLQTKASSCDPHGRGLDAQPWIPGPGLCTTPDLWLAVCRRLQTFGERLQTKASSCERRKIDQRRAGWQLRSPAGRLAVRSSDQRRAGTRCSPLD
jgi:hypothetical protein